MADHNDILALLDSIPYEKRKDPTTARKIAELIATKAAMKQEASIRFQEKSVELNEKMFKPQMDEQKDEQAEQQQGAPQGMAPSAQDVAANPNIGELM
jgi:hypothetical protein